MLFDLLVPNILNFSRDKIECMKLILQEMNIMNMELKINIKMSIQTQCSNYQNTCCVLCRTTLSLTNICMEAKNPE